MRCQMSAPSLEARRNIWPHSVHKIHLSCSPGISSVPLAAISDTTGRADLHSSRVSPPLLISADRDPAVFLSLTVPFSPLFLPLQQLLLFSPGGFLHLPNPDSLRLPFTLLKQRERNHSSVSHLSGSDLSLGQREVEILCVKQHYDPDEW